MAVVTVVLLAIVALEDFSAAAADRNAKWEFQKLVDALAEHPSIANQLFFAGNKPDNLPPWLADFSLQKNVRLNYFLRLGDDDKEKITALEVESRYGKKSYRYWAYGGRRYIQEIAKRTAVEAEDYRYLLEHLLD
ncbi:MAG: hypothetical protein IT292_02700 [Deltaproteobacteria bacterium]|nr:hypothetical protein [Deltaproteobacteria bacterium]